MCHDLDSRPPIPPLAGAAVDGRRRQLASADGASFTAFHAAPANASGAGILITPDVRGLHPFYEELALRFAEAGVAALAIDYFGRTAEPPPRAADFEYQPHVDATRFATLLADMEAGRNALVESGARALFSVGFCFGGRLSFLAATRPELGLAGSIGFYGPPQSGSNDVPAPANEAHAGQAPVLGLFGGDDGSIPQAAIDDFGRRLTEAGIDNSLITYPGAPHSFFDRKAARFGEASADAWRRVLEFVRDHTPSS